MIEKILIVLFASTIFMAAPAYAADIIITAPSSVFITKGMESDFRFFTKNNGASSASFTISLEGYTGARLWGAKQRGFDFSVSEDGRSLSVNNLGSGKSAEFFVRLSSAGAGNSLSILCDAGGCGQKTVIIAKGEVPSFSVINGFSVLIIIFGSLLIFSRIKI